MPATCEYLLSCKQLRLLCPPAREIYQVLPYSVDFKAPMILVRQYLVNEVLLVIKYL